MDIYLNESNIKITDNVFMWWFDNRTRFPSLYNMAQKYLIIPATECTSERVFSTGGIVLESKRSKLSGPHVDMLIFVNFNKDL